MAEAARSAYDLSFQVSPIILVGGIANGTLGKMLPIIALVGQAGALLQGLASGTGVAESFFARFIPVPGGTIISNAVGTYPFANQQVAANAVIQQPLNISLEMIAPVKEKGGYLSKLAIFTSLQSSLMAHNAAGGTYTVATPAYVYSNCLLTGMTDITSGETNQKQVRWQLDFVQPLITQQQATSAYNSLMSKAAGGQQVTSPLWSSANAAAGTPAQGAAQGINKLTGAVNNFLSQPL